jgi:hypothetical protein
VTLYGRHLTLYGELSGAVLVSFMFYQASLAPAICKLSDIFSSRMAALSKAPHIVEVLFRAPCC